MPTENNISNSVCYGTCCTNHPSKWGFYPNPYHGPQFPHLDIRYHSLSTEELEVLTHLANAFNKYKELNESLDDENNEFKLAIHAAQRIVATRVARRVNPEVWRNA